MHNEHKIRPTIFFSVLHDLIRSGMTESCADVEAHFSTGAATYLNEKYPDAFMQMGGIPDESLKELDQYYASYAGCVCGSEYHKYDCLENEGLWLLIMLALNNMYFDWRLAK